MFVFADLTSPAPSTGIMPAATHADSAVRRCLALLHTIIAVAKDLAAQLGDRIREHQATGADRLAQAASRRWRRITTALSYAHILARKLRADPAYRGEPPKACRPPRSRDRPEDLLRGLYDTEKLDEQDRDNADPYASRADRNRRSFERVFAGQSIDQIVDRIRRRMGLCTPLGPWVQATLNDPPPNPDPDAMPSISLTRRVWRIIYNPPRRRAPPGSNRRATGPP